MKRLPRRYAPRNDIWLGYEITSSSDKKRAGVMILSLVFFLWTQLENPLYFR